MERQVQHKSPAAAAEAPDDDLQLVDDKFLLEFINQKPTWLFEARRDGRFPAAIKVGRSNRTPLGEVRRWVRERIAARPPVNTKASK